MTLLATTCLLPCLVSQILFQMVLTASKQLTHVLSAVTIYAIFLIEFGKHFSNCLAVFTRYRFNLSQYLFSFCRSVSDLIFVFGCHRENFVKRSRYGTFVSSISYHGVIALPYHRVHCIVLFCPRIIVTTLSYHRSIAIASSMQT